MKVLYKFEKFVIVLLLSRRQTREQVVTEKVDLVMVALTAREREKERKRRREGDKEREGQGGPAMANRKLQSLRRVQWHSELGKRR